MVETGIGAVVESTDAKPSCSDDGPIVRNSVHRAETPPTVPHEQDRYRAWTLYGSAHHRGIVVIPVYGSRRT